LRKAVRILRDTSISLRQLHDHFAFDFFALTKQVVSQTIEVSLAIPADEYVAMYQGSVRDVVARARDGRTVRFPARILQPFVTHQGIYGRFAIRFDESNRFAGISRLSA